MVFNVGLFSSPSVVLQGMGDGADDVPVVRNETSLGQALAAPSASGEEASHREGDSISAQHWCTNTNEFIVQAVIIQTRLVSVAPAEIGAPLC